MVNYNPNLTSLLFDEQDWCTIRRGAGGNLIFIQQSLDFLVTCGKLIKRQPIIPIPTKFKCTINQVNLILD